MLVTEFLGLNKIEENDKNYLVWTLILLGIALVGSLISLVWGTQYLYGGLLGITAVILTTSLTILTTHKFGVLSSWMIFLVKVGVFATVLLTPVYTSNLNAVGDISMATTLGPINVWASLAIMGTVPLIASFSVNFYTDRIKPLVARK